MVRSVHVVIGGRVQGVGFRWYTLRRAEALGLTGWVRNLPNGDVEAFAQGEAAAIDELVEALSVGPGHAFVARIDVNEAPRNPGLSGFRLR